MLPWNKSCEPYHQVRRTRCYFAAKVLGGTSTPLAIPVPDFGLVMGVTPEPAGLVCFVNARPATLLIYALSQLLDPARLNPSLTRLCKLRRFFVKHLRLSGGCDARSHAVLDMGEGPLLLRF